ncbi:DNA phosphorothioation-dependent restriction protein DptH [uncultured Methanobrevibacter sp.]|uniref:DNA phosphorothioation-dependent restriction protein DptH n=1 Tax=uncultured Methanobrevibacter sp. TaxID=253161 RepID=UPI0025D6E941|nr:DNA phosphorothioation-dependent restriction protein DptH [uncultured Methanobrevibacter sp.]
MSNQFYDYLSNKLLDYFKENKILNGERFFISLDEDEQVLLFYNSLKKIGNTKLACSDFSYIHEKSNKRYDTFAIKINDINLVVSESLSINMDYLVTLRNQVTSQQGDWENTALLVICTEGIDSINKGMRDLQKEGMPLNIKSISDKLEEEINHSKLNPTDQQIAKFSLTVLEEDLFQTTLWDYETILSIINKGHVDDDDLIELNLFKDGQLDSNPPATRVKRLKENYETFNEINKISQYGDKKEKLEKMFSSTGVSLLSKDDWYTAEWKSVKKYKDDYVNQQKPLNYIENTEKVSENGLVYWERPNSFTTKVGKRKRNIIVFNTNSSSEVSLKFTFDQILNNAYVGKNSKNITDARGKSLSVKFDVNQNEPTFKSIRYTHKNESSSDFTFRIAVLNVKPEIINTIKSRYIVNASRKKIEVINDEDSHEIEFGLNSSKKTEKSILEEDEKVYLYDDESIIISEQSPAWENGKLTFILDYHNNFIPFVVKEKDKKSLPVKSYVLWNLKRVNMDNFIYNGVKAVQDVNSFNLREEFKDFLKMEREIINNEIFYAKRNIDGSLRKIDISLSEELENAYFDIIKYYQTFDDSPEDNLPSLVYLNDDLKELYEKFIKLFNEEISEIEENSILSDFEDKKNLLKLGRVETDTKIMYSPLSPLNIAYQLEVSNQCKNEDLSVNMIERVVPNNLVPYICSDDGKDLFRPIYQEEAHEWLIYEKSEEVSIGTTNVFISNVVTEKLNQFVKHFNYLFSFNNSSPIRINLINIQDDREVVKGIFNFIRARLPDKTKTKNVIPVEINIYNDAEKSYFDNLFECQSENQLLEEFGIKNLKTDIFDGIDIIHMIQNNISYYKHPLKKEEYEYAHLSFYKVKSHNNIANDNMEKIDTGLSLNGLLSSVTSTTKHSEYRTGFGTNNILNKENPLIQTVINLNELVENSRNFGKNKYLKDTSVVTTVELEEDNIEDLYDKSHWVTFIEPTFGIEYFDSEDDLIIIHYSDQYSSSNKYDTITVTNKSTQYEEIIRDFLHSKNVNVSDEELYDVIKLFNSINGEWLLRVISNSGYYDREKLSIISTIKYCLAILDHEDIVWIPISMEEILRIAGNVKLDKNKGIFDSKLIKGNHSDDLLFIGVKFNEDNRIEIIFYPIEVKIGLNQSSTIKKGKNQLDNTYELLKTQLQKINNESSEFRNKFFRNFFIQILLSNEQKLVTNHIWDEKGLNRIEDFKAELLNDEFSISYDLEKYIGIGSLVSFKKDSHHISIYMDINKQVIELPEYYAYYGLATPIEKIHHDIQSDNTDILADTLLSHVDISDIEVDEITDSDEDVEILNDNVDSENVDESSEDLDKEKVIDNSEEYGVEKNDSDSNIENESTEDPDKSSSDFSNIRALIGTQKGYSHKIYWEFGHSSLANRHMLIQGKSGQGKTYFIQRMLKELSNQGIPSIIIDYTDGFKKSKLEKEFVESLGDKIDQHLVFIDKFPLNPFKRNLIELDDEFFPENNVSVAGRFKSVVNSVYNFGDQQLNTIYNAVLRGLNNYDEDMDLSILKEELRSEDSGFANSVLNKLSELLDINPFESNKFDWSNVLDNADGKVLIIQLTGLSKDIQRVISELILWDLWYYKASSGSEDKPFIVVLDEAHNLDFGSDSPCSKILTEGRKFGWSGWFATQSVKGTMKQEEIAKLANAEEKIYFHPTDVSAIAKELSKDNEDRRRYENELSQLNKGYCIVQGTTLNSNGELYHPNPLTVKIDEIVVDDLALEKSKEDYKEG